MPDFIVGTFKVEFDRFHDLLVQQIDACPDEAAWVEKTGRFAYWWHILHALALIEVYALPPGEPSRQTYCSPEVVFAKTEPERAVTREEMRAFAADMKELAHAFFASQNESTLALTNSPMSEGLGRECTNLNALVGMVRHYCYHIGCLDSLLRSRGIPGVL